MAVIIQGADEAGDRIATLDVFKNAQNVKVDPDKPLQQARYVTLKVPHVCGVVLDELYCKLLILEKKPSCP